jgi:hypothetical protein
VLSSLPAFFNSIFSFVNPRIIELMWGTTALAGFAIATVTYVIARLLSDRTILLGIIGGLLIFILIASLILLLAVVGRVLSFSPPTNAFLVRLFFVGFVTSLCGCISLGLTYITRPLLPAPTEAGAAH